MKELEKLNKKLTEILNYEQEDWYCPDCKKIIIGSNKCKCGSNIQPLYNLEDVLIAFQIVRKFHTTLDCSNKGYLTYSDDSNDIYKQTDWILGKSLFEQKNKTIKFIIEVLK